jgi:2-polyprenyl-6-methoxyphenol hydroxylase-like FAD-dependent oxidoreductase
MRAEPVYDVAIAGGGPAGCATALALAQERPDLRIAVIEASAFDRWRIGETLAPGGRQLLEGLGCWERVSRAGALESFGTSAAWGSDERHDNDYLFSVRGNAWHLDRTRFDAELTACAEDRGVDVLRRSRFVEAQRSPAEGWRLTIARDGERQMIGARIVVDATGRAACFASRQGAGRIVDDRLTGVAMMFRAAAGERTRDATASAETQRDATTLVEAQRDGWWYSASIPGERIVAAWMSDADLIRRDRLHEPARLLAHLNAAHHTSARLASCEPDGGVGIWSARSQRLRHVCGERWIATGDAASAFDPLSSAGVLKALYGGKLAAFAVLDLLRGEPSGMQRYRAYVEREYDEYLATRSWFYAQERRWPGAAFWSRRHVARGTAAASTNS